ncbi:MAG: glycoside hydrolase family 15 protein [Patescibacteria group bacterium]
MFDKELILEKMESLKQQSGAFIASSTTDYQAMWIRDHLYMAFSYYYLGMYDKLIEGVQVIFDVFHKHRYKLEKIIQPRNHCGQLTIKDLIHAKYCAHNLEEMNTEWGHHQLDEIGLFLHIVADLDFKNIKVVRNKNDEEIIHLLVFYLLNVRYWEEPDFGMWEECYIRHSSSIGAVVGGLSYIKRRGLATMPDELIALGKNALYKILPCESRDICAKSHHSHDCDAAQLFLIWPFNIVDNQTADLILHRIIEGHLTEQNGFHRLVQPFGINRYWGDDYYRDKSGVSAQWQWEFLISIIYSNKKQYELAVKWFKTGANRITAAGCITEAFIDGKPNNHTPLGWMHALALIAFSKLPNDLRKNI